MRDAAEERIVLTPEEAAFIDRFTAERCRPHAEVMAERLRAFVEARRTALFDAADGFALAAGPAAAGPAREVRAPDEPVRFVFASEGDAEAPDAWRAELTVPPGATAETPVAVAVTGRAAADGVFTVSGCALPLADGAAEIPFGLFLAGVKDTAVSLARADGTKVPGRLYFF